jgi:tetratricopeptide (TPR) repeat protein
MRLPALGRWAVVALFAAGVFAAGLTAIADGDIFWHLAAGRQMAQTRALLTADPFSSGALGRPWIDVHWLFQLGAYAAYRAGGLGALVLSKAALSVVGALVLLHVVRREAGPRFALPFAAAFVLALFLVRHLLVVRPVIVTLVFLALHLLVLEGVRRGGRARALAWLPAMQIVWVNCQGLAPLGPALIAAYLAGAAMAAAFAGRRWYPFAPEGGGRASVVALAGTLALSLAAAFVSPFGAHAALLPLELLRRITPTAANVFAREVAENVPPFVLERTAPGSFGHLAPYLALLALAFFVARQRLSLSRVLVIATVTALALMANRNVLLLYWLATPLAALEVAPSVLALAARLARRGPRLALLPAAAGAASLLAVVAVGLAAAAREPPLSAPTPFHFPTGSARWLAERGRGGDVFAADHQGGYLIWTLFPRYRPYIDTRLILRTPDEFAAYLELLGQPERFDAFQARHRFAYAVLPTGYPDRYLGLVEWLGHSPDWKLVFTDGAETLWAYRAGEPPVALGARATTEALVAGLQERYASDPALLAAARRSLARLDLVLGHEEEARHVLAPMTATDPAALALLARCHLATGDLAAAEAIARRMLAARADDVEALMLLARISFARGQSADGLAWLRRALEQDPYDAEARALLAELERAPAAR